MTKVAASSVVVVGSLAESLTNFRGPMLRAMAERGHRVVAVAPDPPGPVAEQLARWGVEYRQIAMERVGMNPVRDLQTLSSLAALMREVRPSAFFGYTIKPVVYGSLAARIAGVPRICPMITGITHDFLRTDVKGRIVGGLAFALLRVALAGAHRVFFQNPDDLGEFVRRGALPTRERAVLVGGSGVDLDFFQVAPPQESTSFLLIARLLVDKGIREYVEAARLIKRSHPHVVFRLAGWAENKPTSISERELQAWIDEGTIEFLGRLDDVRPALASSAVYVLPSYREGTPRTVLEAMAMARPVITTDTPGCRQTVRPGETGFLVPVKTVEPLAAAMERFILDSSLAARMGRAGRLFAEQHFDVQKVNETLLREMGLR